MKKLLLIVLVAPLGLLAQGLPNANIQDLNGGTMNAADIQNAGHPMVVSFWATWCKPCIAELMAINDELEGLQTETGVKVVAVSIDDARNAPKVRGFVASKGWDAIDVYLDPNSDLKRALNVNNVPHTFLLDNTGKIVKQHTSYTPGQEVILFEEIEKLAAGEELKPMK